MKRGGAPERVYEGSLWAAQGAKAGAAGDADAGDEGADGPFGKYPHKLSYRKSCWNPGVNRMQARSLTDFGFTWRGCT